MIPAGARFAGGPIADARGDVFPGEIAALGAVARRRLAEFRAGRIFARRALEELDVAAAPILIRADRAPAWPAGIVGSISHADDYCGVLVARSASYAAIGLDIENARRIDAEIANRIVTPRERREGARFSPQLAGPYPALIFSAKEALYKAFAPLAQRFLEFHDVEIDVDAARSAFVGRVIRDADDARASDTRVDAVPADEPREFAGRFIFDGDYVVTWAMPAADWKLAACAE